MAMTGTMKSTPGKGYLPAAGSDWALPLYDPIVKLLGFESTKHSLLKQADVRREHRVLDIGCGTGTLATQIKTIHPSATVVGLDPDPKALERARRKAEHAGVSIRFDQGFADEMPYPAASFDRVLSSFMFHHLPPDKRGQALREVRRVLSPGGSLHLLDFSHANSGDGVLTRLFHSNHRLEDNSPERILALMEQADSRMPSAWRAGASCWDC